MTLMRWEFRKLLVRRFTIVLLALVVLALTFAFVDIFKARRIYMKDDGYTAAETHYGLDAIRWERKHSAPFEGRTVDEAFVRDARAYINEHFPNRLYVQLELQEVIGNFLETKTVFPGDPVYLPDGTVVAATEVKQTTEVLPIHEVTGGKTLVYRYSGGWVHLIYTMGRLAAPCAFVGIFLCSTLYSGEYSSGTDAVLFTTKNGKKRLGRAKFFFGMLFPAALVTLTLAVYALTVFSVYGFSGGTGSAALNSYFSMSLDVGGRLMQGFLPEDISVTYIGYAARTYLSVLLMTLICSALALLISSLIRSAILSIGISGAILLVPSFVISGMKSRYGPSFDPLTIASSYLPIDAFSDAYMNWKLMQIPLGGSYLHYIPVLLSVFLVVAVPSYFIAMRAYDRHQVL